MKLSTRFSGLAFSIALVSAIATTVCLIYWEYTSRQTLWLAQTEMAIALNPSWPIMLHFQTEENAAQELSLIAARAAENAFLAAYTVSGTRVARYPSSETTPSPLERSRASATAIQRSYRQVETPLTGNLPDWAGFLPGANLIFVVSIPVLSPVSPLDVDVSYQQYRTRLAEDNGQTARHVTGYIEAGISQQRLLYTMLPTAAKIIGVTTTSLLMAFFLIRRFARNISRPLEHIAEVAHAIITTDETLPKSRLPINRNDEIGDIANVINSVLEGVQRTQNKLNVDRTLLSMKVDDTAKKLSAAEQQVHQTRSQIKRVAYFDGITGLPNRNLMLEQLALLMQIAARERKHLGLMLLEIQNLRRINETLGRTAGDQILREISGRITDSVRNSDLVSRDNKPQDIARVGNDEFCVLLHGITGTDDALSAASRLLENIQRPVHVNGTTLTVQFRIGVALAPDDAKTPDELVRAADVALNHAKITNASSAVVYDREMDAQGSERFQLETDMRQALAESEFELHYQPQIDTLSGRVSGAEALIRWNHPKLGMVPPFKFIPIAEETGQIIELGNWIVDQACKDFQALRAEGIALDKISVNVSAAQLTEQFVEHVELCVSQYNIKRDALELEITEGLLVQNIDVVMELLNTLKHQVGVRLSVDDFGTGYSSLAYLSRFPLDELKVDRSFVLAMEKDEAAAKVTGAIIAIGRELGLEIVVEGVETEAQLTSLKHLGGTTIQGYLFSKPLRLEDLKHYVATFSL